VGKKGNESRSKLTETGRKWTGKRRNLKKRKILPNY
jgi:hypothetical protein